MKFKELREANLSKAQIKKVHDKADDLPKNDFIKRYGKEGDAVRFATATNIVKKQLGIGEGVIGNKWRKSARSARPNLKIGNIELVRADNPKTDVHTIKVNGKKIGSFSLDSDHWVVNIDGKKGQGTYNEIDDIVKDIRKGKMYFEALDGKDKETIKPIIKQLQKSVKAHGKQAKQLQKDIKDEVEEGFKNDAERQAAVASLYSKLGLKGASKRSREKDKGKKKEEVEVTEAVSDAYVKQIARMTDRNDHFGARVELARMMKDKELMKMYDSLEKMHSMNLGGNDALTLRSKLDKNLKFRLTQKFKTDADRLMNAL